ncbi:MAG: helix-turn-helix domain-containing protein [Pelobium sp.]
MKNLFTFAYQTVGIEILKMADTREYIIIKATNLFLQKGFKEVTMKELVESAGLSKGAFYHYFDSKEQIFEEVALNFYNAKRINNYDTLSTTSLKEFYGNWINNLLNVNNKVDEAIESNTAFTQNHYNLIFDALRLIPSFAKLFDNEQHREMEAWIKIIDIAKQNSEIKSTISSKEIAKMFIYVSDGLATNLITQNKISKIKIETIKILDSLYKLLQ